MTNSTDWVSYSGPDLKIATVPAPDPEEPRAEALESFLPVPAAYGTAATRAVLNGLLAFERIALDSQEGFQMLSALLAGQGHGRSLTGVMAAAQKHGYVRELESPDLDDVLSHLGHRAVVVASSEEVATLVGVDEEGNAEAITHTGVRTSIEQERLEEILLSEESEIFLV